MRVFFPTENPLQKSRRAKEAAARKKLEEEEEEEEGQEGEVAEEQRAEGGGVDMNQLVLTEDDDPFNPGHKLKVSALHRATSRVHFTPCIT